MTDPQRGSGDRLSEPVEQYLDQLGRISHDLLGSNLVGAYLHGSAVLGGFNPGRSDIDVLIVVRDPLTIEGRRAFAERVSESSLPCPAAGLELSIVCFATAQHPAPSVPYELHVNTHENKVVEDDGRSDPDLILHFLICREHGRLLGPGQPASSVFAPLPTPMVLDQFRTELEWAMTEPDVPSRYLVLNAARNWYFIDTGHVTSKIAGGRWARERISTPAVIDAALDDQQDNTSGRTQRTDPAEARKFATDVLEKINTAIAGLRKQPPPEVCRAFGVAGPATRFESGEGTTFRISDLVLKPTSSPAEAEWIGRTLESLVETGFRLARPVRTARADLLSDGWTAWQWVEGQPTKDRWEEVITAGERFHAALRKVDCPAFIAQRTHQWAVADRVAFNEEQANIPAGINELVAQLQRSLAPIDLPNQVVHGDLTQNVLLAEDLPPAIIDFSPYFRPTGYASAIVAVDAIVWFDAPPAVVDLIQPAETRCQLLARGLIFRLIAAALPRKSDPDALITQADAYRPLVERVLRGLEVA